MLKSRKMGKPIYNIDVLTINIEFIWRGLETGERWALASLSICFLPSQIKFYIYRQYTNIVFTLQ